MERSPPLSSSTAQPETSRPEASRPEASSSRAASLSFKSSFSSSGVPSSSQPALGAFAKKSWSCDSCSTVCYPVMSESRCLCGHRSKEHKVNGVGPCSGSGSGSSSRCPCPHFYLVVAEGAWVVRCRCKHRHTEHDCRGPPYRCGDAKCAGKCEGFDSPWVCNCGHGWKSHSMKDRDATAIIAKNGARHVVRMDGLLSNAPKQINR